MGGKSSANTSTANTQQTQNTQQINTSTTSTEVGAGGVGATGGRDVTVTNITTDAGALKTAGDIAANALGSASDVAQAGLTTGRQLGQSSLDFANEFGNNAINAVEHSTENGLNSALDYGTGVTSGAFDLLGHAFDSLSKSSSDTATTLGGAITQAANASRTDSSQNIDNLIKYGSYAVGAIGLGIAVIFIFRK